MIAGIGDVGALKLIERLGSAAAIFTASHTQLQQCKLKASVIEQIQAFDFKQVDAIVGWGDQPDRSIIPLGSPLYPPQLAQIHSPPIVLFTLGNPELLFSPQIAVVGSRRPSAQGLENTRAFCEHLCQQGITVTSGLANGIDGEAHRASLSSNGLTIAVAGTGLNRVYPANHRELARQIASKGLIISEKLPDQSVNAGSFPQRNRIIAGLSLGTLVVEAALKSGSLITAKCALEAGREVYAIPGSIHSPLSKGCHNLIKQGAKLTETVEDIIEDLPCVLTAQVEPGVSFKKAALEQEDAEFLKHIDFEITPIDTIVARSKLTVDAVTNKLLTLELEGWVINSAGGYIRQ